MKLLFDFLSFNQLNILLFLLFFGLWTPSDLFSQVHPGFPSLTPLQNAESLLSMKRYAESIDAFENLLDRKEKRGYAVRGIVRAYRGSDRAEIGKKFLKNRLSIAKEPSDFLYGLGYWYYSEGQIKESTIYLEEAIKANPNHALALNNLGAVLSEVGDHREAEQRVKEALELNPSESMFFQNLFLIYKSGGWPEEYRREYESYLEKSRPKLALGYGKVLARNLRQKAFKDYSKGNVKKAVENFEEMVSIYKNVDYTPGITAAWFSLGLLYEEQNKIRRAIDFFRKVLKISPDHIQARQRLLGLEGKNDR
tara:strand:- start:3717 stop:4643 length:927 start_codon:yes stop_codon:yes gene_type:complete